ncbi:TMCO1/EMC3 family protein [Candidatus Woesearchaeota archaeon]|nr:TMCO1/EMC3 family protein [Candidatus Woesearchaeota archaeon]
MTIAFESIMDPLLGWTLSLPPLVAILIVSLILSVFITLIYKYTTDQKMMKNLKESMKASQAEMRKHKDNPAKVMAMQKEAMEKNMKYMMSSFKSTFITMIPIILIFGWLNAHLAYEPIQPGAEFTTTMTFKNGVSGEAMLSAPDEVALLSDARQTIEDAKASWTLEGAAGRYLLEYAFGDKVYDKEVLIDGDRYTAPVKQVKDTQVKEIRVGNEKLIVLDLLGWRIGWLGTYIIFSILFSMVMRKLLKVY